MLIPDYTIRVVDVDEMADILDTLAIVHTPAIRDRYLARIVDISPVTMLPRRTSGTRHPMIPTL